MSDTGKRAGSGRRWAVVRISALAVVLAMLVVVGLTVPVPDQQQVKAFADQAGWLGAVVFVLGYALLTLIPVPKAALNIVAGFVWGFWAGAILVYIGALLGAGGAFAVGRALGREAVEQFTGARVARVDAVLRRRGLMSVIAARLIPLLPFTVLNYTAGLTAVSRRNYAIGTAVGIVPGSLAYVAVGAFALEAGPVLWIALGVLGALALAGLLLGLRSRRQSPRPR